jgi:hypothetical protein
MEVKERIASQLANGGKRQVSTNLIKEEFKKQDEVSSVDGLKQRRKILKTNYSLASLILLQQYIEKNISYQNRIKESLERFNAIKGFLCYSLQSGIDTLSMVDVNNTYSKMIDPKLIANKKPNDVFDYDQFTTFKVIEVYRSLVKEGVINGEKKFILTPFISNKLTVSLLDEDARQKGEPLLLGIATQCCLTLDRTGYNYVLAQMFDPNVNVLTINREDGVMLACIQVWLNEEGHLVLDTIDIAKMKKKEEKINPKILLDIVKNVSSKLLEENPQIKSTTLGIGGNTIKNILTEEEFKELTIKHSSLTRDNCVDFFSEKFHDYKEKDNIMVLLSGFTGLPFRLTDKESIIKMQNDHFMVTQSTEHHGFDSCAQTVIESRSIDYERPSHLVAISLNSQITKLNLVILDTSCNTRLNSSDSGMTSHSVKSDKPLTSQMSSVCSVGTDFQQSALLNIEKPVPPQSPGPKRAKSQEPKSIIHL